MNKEQILSIWNSYYKAEVQEHNITLKEGIEMLANQASVSYEQVINVLYFF